jgi:indole-3-glycerol phosphate synthase
MFGGITIVAEVKVKSPFGYVSERSWEEQFKLADDIGDIVAIHTDSRWAGSIEDIKRARKMTSKPLLAKGIHEEDDMIDAAVKAGADYVLVVGRVPTVHKEICWVEPLSLSQLATIPENYKIVWNARDIGTGKPKPETFEQARDAWGGWLCQASFIRHINDVKAGADGILVGQGLAEFVKSLDE